ncbi:MAG: ABC transporter permease [Candidatus Hydrogenedentes bacterium]|nr:ABC transporter permease [Candidatus Hydrogenedentota bacterium]
MSGVFLIVRRSLRQHALSTVVTVLAVALATGLVMGVFSIQAQSYNAFTGGNIGFDAVLGARGSQLQLVLNTVFHLETSPGNIPWSMYQAIKADPRVKTAIPYALGDNYLGFRIVGTTPDLFTGFTFQDGRRFTVESGGRVFEEGYAEAVIGSFAAQETGLRVGDTFQPYHGLSYNPESKHEETYTVVGVLEPTNMPNDRVLWIPIEGIYRMSSHVLRGTGEVYVPSATEAIPDEHKEVSAVMLQFRTPIAGANLDATINKQGKEATLAWPIGAVLAEFFQKVGWINRVFELVAYLVVLVSAGAILASIYNTINERRREFAILRALGARRGTVFTAIVAEAAAISAIGSILGLGFYAIMLAVAAVIVRKQTGVVLDVFSLHPSLILAPLGMTGLGALAGVVPALKAYATDVADNLVPHS